MEIIAKNLKETEKLAADFVKKILKTPEKKEATVVLLEGELGAGKTAFVKGVAKSLGLKNLVQSPTFVIQKIYKLKNKKFSQLFHIDAYRFKNAAEARVLNFESLLKNPCNLIFVEWPERMGKLVPKDSYKLHFTFVDESKRKIKIHPPKFSAKQAKN